MSRIILHVKNVLTVCGWGKTVLKSVLILSILNDVKLRL